MSKEGPLVSIIVPVYNAADFLHDTIAAATAQTYKNWELLLVDDASSDDSVSIIKKYAKKDKRIKLFEHDGVNRGAAMTRNKGIDEAKGRYIAFLDADDQWVPEKLTRQVSFAQKNDHAFTYSSYQFADEKGNATSDPVRVPESITYSQALKNHIIWTSTVLLDTHAIPDELLKMPDIRRGQDAATWLQILRSGIVAYGLDESLAYYRRTSNSLSANKLKAVGRTWYLFRRVERLSVARSLYNFVWYAMNAVSKRL